MSELLNFFTNLDYMAAVNAFLNIVAAVEGEHPLFFWGTSPLWAWPVTWVIYGWAMGLKADIKARGGFSKLPRLTQLCYIFLGGPAFIVGLLLDYYINFVVMTPLLLKWPKFYTGRIKGVIPWAWPRLTTARLTDYYGTDSWRGKICTGLCDIFLHPYDKDHCK